MEYISVSEAADKFSLSPRRVQILCEQGRIDGANMLSGVWLVPKTANKPIDLRKSSNHLSEQQTLFDETDFFSTRICLSEACNMLSISEATGRNWIKLGKIKPSKDGKSFERDYIEKLVSEIQNDNSDVLKSRRNKKMKNGFAAYNDYIYSSDNTKSLNMFIESSNTVLTNSQIRLVIANAAVQMIMQKMNIKNNTCNALQDFLNNHLEVGIYARLVKDILEPMPVLDTDIEAVEVLLRERFHYIPMEDTLGYIYISLRNMSERKTSGAYYTPFSHVETLINSLSELDSLADKTFFDPCCGTGNFLIRLKSFAVNAENLFAQDIDELSVKIARLNIALTYGLSDIEFLYDNFTVSNTLYNAPEKSFDIILGNPPWGYSFSEHDRTLLRTLYKTAPGRSIESFDLFLERSISLLSKRGYLAFVLPEAVLNVKSHKNIREIILNSCSFKFVSYIGNAFSGVQCPSIILGLHLDQPGSTDGCKITNSNGTFYIEENRNLTSSEFLLGIDNEQFQCIKAIESLENTFFLRDNAQFALGIVTGDNKAHLSNSCKSGFEVILKGSDIHKYRISSGENYIKYRPENFQQVAPTKIYRSPEKLLYRFICDTPVFAYDNQQTLTLNSCNILIPEVPGFDIKYIMAILNSRVTTYYLKSKFNSVKLLRSHIEQMPIPSVPQKLQISIINQVDSMLTKSGTIYDQYNELDDQIMDIYNLSTSERRIIHDAVTHKKEFLP